MPMTPETIEMHFKEAMDLALRLKEEADKLNKLAGEEMMQILCSTRTGWNGRCAELVLEKEVRLAARLKEEACCLNKIAAEMEGRAREMYQSEILNYRLAASRIY